jgi:hypothetical protein
MNTEIEGAIHQLKRAALTRVATDNKFLATPADIEMALKMHSQLSEALTSLLQRESSFVRLGYAVGKAYRYVTNWNFG